MKVKELKTIRQDESWRTRKQTKLEKRERLLSQQAKREKKKEIKKEEKKKQQEDGLDTATREQGDMI